jgi:hydrogenase expression/formation protein HypC
MSHGLPDDDLQIPAAACTLAHDGCVVCADAGIPVWVIAVQGDDALCRDSAGNQARIAVELVAPVRHGEGLLTHGGVAIGKLPLAHPSSADGDTGRQPT